jgi:hypothetical protein
MQGGQRQGGEPGDKLSGRRAASLNGTGKVPAISKRPPGTFRVDQPPPTPRVARPQRDSSSRTMRRTLFVLGIALLICVVLACFFGYAVFNYFNGLNVSSGPAGVADDFLKSISGPQPDYDQAYKDLGTVITIQMSPDQFKQQAQNIDRCYGLVTNYSEVANSAIVQANSESFSYNITRSKSTRMYQLHLTLQQEQDGSNVWRITQYGNDLGPGQPACQ